jgi:hypothetical protein
VRSQRASVRLSVHGVIGESTLLPYRPFLKRRVSGCPSYEGRGLAAVETGKHCLFADRSCC